MRNNIITYIKKSRKRIIDTFYSVNRSKNAEELEYLNQTSRKFIVAFLVALASAGILSAVGAGAWVIGGIASVVLGGTVSILEIKQAVIEGKNISAAKKSYERVREVVKPIEEELKEEVKPVLSSYYINDNKKELENVNKVVNDSNVPEYPNLVNFILDDGSSIIAKEDYFINMALMMDEKIFWTQYDGYENDLRTLHALMKEYVDYKDIFASKKEVDEKESELLQRLGKLYVMTNLKIENYRKINDGPKLVLVPKD